MDIKNKKITLRKYTVQDLIKNSKEYNDNFNKLLNSVGTEEQNQYIKEEKKLNKKDIAIRDSLGILIRCACPQPSLNCEFCTGILKNGKITTGKGKLCVLKNPSFKHLNFSIMSQVYDYDY